MFEDAGVSTDVQMGPMLANFVPWVREKLEDGSYVGWLVEEGGRLVGGAGLWVMEWPPHFLDGATSGLALTFTSRRRCAGVAWPGSYWRWLWPRRRRAGLRL